MKRGEGLEGGSGTRCTSLQCYLIREGALALHCFTAVINGNLVPKPILQETLMALREQPRTNPFSAKSSSRIHCCHVGIHVGECEPRINRWICRLSFLLSNAPEQNSAPDSIDLTSVGHKAVIAANQTLNQPSTLLQGEGMPAPHLNPA